MNAQKDITHGNRFPFDASDEWWAGDASAPPPPTDWAHVAARGVIANLQDRRGIKHELCRNDIDEEDRVELIESLAAIIRAAATTPAIGQLPAAAPQP